MTFVDSLMADLVDISTISVLTLVTILIGRFAYFLQFSFSYQRRVLATLAKCLIFLVLEAPVVVSYFTLFTPTSTVFVWFGIAFAVAVIIGKFKWNIFPQPKCNDIDLEQWARGALIKAKPRPNENFMDCLLGNCYLSPRNDHCQQATFIKDECFGPLKPAPFVQRNNNRNFGPMQPFVHIPNNRVFGPPECDLMAPGYSVWETNGYKNPPVHQRQPRRQKRRQQNNPAAQAPLKQVRFQKDPPCNVAPPAPLMAAHVSDTTPAVSPVTSHVPVRVPSPSPVPSQPFACINPCSDNISTVRYNGSPVTQNVIVNQTVTPESKHSTIDIKNDSRDQESKPYVSPKSPTSPANQD